MHLSSSTPSIVLKVRNEFLYNQKQHVILVSGDEDIRQLVGWNVDDKGKKILEEIYNKMNRNHLK